MVEALVMYSHLSQEAFSDAVLLAPASTIQICFFPSTQELSFRIFLSQSSFLGIEAKKIAFILIISGRMQIFKNIVQYFACAN
jgi:hypothetical protein